MISVAEASGGFSALTRMYKRLVDDFIGQLPLQPQSFPLAPTDNAFKQGMCADTTYVVKGGMLGMRCQERKLFTWDEGDMILPDAAGNDEVTYYAESAVLLAAYPTVKLVETVLADERLVTRGGERFWPYPDQVEDCRARGERAVALLADRCVDLVGDPAWLRVPETLEQRRTPETVSDTEVADAAAEVIAGLLGDVRAMKAERGAGAGDRPAGRRSLLSRLRGRRSPSR